MSHSFKIGLAVLVAMCGWSATPDPRSGARILRRLPSGRLHAIATVVAGDAKVVAQLPDGRWVVSVAEEAASGLALPDPSSKTSVDYPEAALPVVVSFYRDVSAADAEAVLNASGVIRLQHPNLLPNERLVQADAAQIENLAEWDEVARVFRASADLSAGTQVRGCTGPETAGGQAGFYIATEGNGWDGAGAGATDLTWSVQSTGSSLPTKTVTDIIARALAEWSNHAALRFSRSSAEGAWRDLAFSFTRGEHFDPYPFDGRSGMLAHAFYPAGVNPEPIAGDVHLDDDETWSEGGDPDLYSVVLHEIGHALGLGHSDRPGAVMYPYHRQLTTLQPDDIAALQRLYRAASVQELQVVLFAAPATTAQTAIQLSGAVTGGQGDVSVRWSSGTASGTASGGRQWRTPVVPLAPGGNRITITAVDQSGATATREAAITVSAAAPQQKPSTSADRVSPSVAIRFPALVVYGTSAPQITVRGTASDNVGVREVTWQCGSRAGVASGTTSWAFDLPLFIGDNRVIVRATDQAGNTRSRSVLITRR